MRRFSDWLYKISKAWVTLAALVVFMLFTALVLPGQTAGADSRAPGVGSPDTSFLYSADDLYRMAEAYGLEGREAYIRARFTFDLAWPLVYTAFLSTSISLVFTKAFAPGSRWRPANLAPVLGALFDILENSAASLVMLRYPERTPVVDWLAPGFTLVKWIFVGGSFVLLLVGVGVAARRRIAARGVAQGSPR